VGSGHCLPAQVVSNDDLAVKLGVDPGSLTARTGILRRHYAGDGLGPSDLAHDAAVAALSASGRTPEDVDLIVFATMTPDIPFPGPGCFLQAKLGCRTVGALDVRAQCAGFLFALATADRFIRSGLARLVLVAGGEVHSTALDFSPRGAAVTPCFGDGAGVLLLAADAGPGVLGMVLHSDPGGLERFWCEFPASRHYPTRMEREHLEAGLHFYVLEAEAIHADAERALVAAAGEVLDRVGVRASDVALVLAHYFDPRVARRAAEQAGFAADRVVATAERAGHIAAAGLPIALAEARAAGRVGAGDLVCCLAFGAGFSSGAALLRMS
jgi:3-oxoacyl-[acyl-carrier-protein] synthase-3